MNKKYVFFKIVSVVFILIFICISGCGDDNSQSVIPTPGPTSTVSQYMRKGPYLILGEESNSMTVLWQTSSTIKMLGVSSIKWGYTEDELDSRGVAQKEVIRNGDNQFSYTIKNLDYSKRVYYQVTILDPSGSAHKYNGSFMSPPAPYETAVSFYAYGDTRDNPPIHNDVLIQMINDSEENPALRQTICLHTGDFVLRGLIEDRWDNDYFYYRKYEDTNKFLTMFPIMASVGNHEFYPANIDDATFTNDPPLLLKKYWPYPFYEQGDHFYYSFDYGPAHFAIVDVYTLSYDKGSPQYEWLKNDLEKSDKPWKFVVFHHPAYAAGTAFDFNYGPYASTERIQENLCPLFRDQGIKLVIQGHRHYYSRSYVPDDDIQYLVLGGGGAVLKDPDKDYFHVVSAAKEYHFARIDILSESRLEVKVLNVIDSEVGGDIIDQFTIEK